MSAVRERGRFVQVVPLADRFWEKVDRSGGSESCWLWLANTNGGTISESAYGRFKVDGRNRLAHRVAWELIHGSIPNGLWVLHRCDNPKCVNPGHLFLGTRSDNMRDAGRKGRLAHQTDKYWVTGDRNPARRHPERLRRGAACHQARLSEANVREIRRSGESYRALGRRFGVNDKTIRAAAIGLTWRHIDG